MPRLRDMHDLYWDDSGDICLDQDDKDLKDTKKENYRGAIQRVQARIGSSKGDWSGSPQTGANLRRFHGRPNSAETGRAIESALTNELVRGSFLLPNEVEVSAFPISKTHIATFVRISPLGQAEAITLINSYDLADNKVSVRN